MPAGCLCLFSGAVLGGLFLAFKLLRLLLRGGKICAAIFDVLFGVICAVVAFLCALAVDKGRLRLFQVVLQLIGAWGAIASLDPLINGGVAWLRKMGSRLRRFFRHRVLRPVRGGLQWLAWKLMGLVRRVLPKRKRKVKRRSRQRRKQRGRNRRGKGAKQDPQNRQNPRRNMDNPIQKSESTVGPRNNVPVSTKKTSREKEKTEKTP